MHPVSSATRTRRHYIFSSIYYLIFGTPFGLPGQIRCRRELQEDAAVCFDGTGRVREQRHRRGVLRIRHQQRTSHRRKS